MSSSSKHQKKNKQIKKKLTKAYKKALKAKKDKAKQTDATEHTGHTESAGKADQTRKTEPIEETQKPHKVEEADFMAAFDRQVIKGIFAEWQNAWAGLPDFIRIRMRQPLFSIREMTGRLGTWRKDRREISLSRDLVTHYRWDDIRDVLLHEMAHQVAHEGLGAEFETAHGPAFKKACMLLRANPATSTAYRPLRDRLGDGESLDESDRIMLRIRKLMALSTSSNPNEAHAAMQKAYELIARHNISLIEKRYDQNYISIFIGTPRLRHFQEDYHLAALLQEFYFVHGVWIPSWVLEKEKMGRVLEISGTCQNVQIAEYVHDAVIRYIDASWDDYRQKTPFRLNRYRKTDFSIGIIQGFRTTLQSAAKDITNHSDSLVPVIITDPALENYIQDRYPRLQRSSRKGPGYNEKVLSDGVETGKKLIIAKGITQDSTPGDWRLPAETSPTG